MTATADFSAHDRITVSEIRASLPTVAAIYRFGSSAAGTATSASDIDLAVLPEAPLAARLRVDIQERLAEALRRPVDLVDLRSVGPVLAIQVVTQGLLLYDANPDVRGAFEDSTYSAYARLNEERRGILERIAAEGTIYGR